MHKGPVIVLDLSNAELVARLRLKLLQYEERIKRDPFKAPELKLDPHYKQRILAQLLQDGRVHTWDLSRTLSYEDNMFDKSSWQNACSVVKDYVQTGGVNNIGGKLPELH